MPIAGTLTTMSALDLLDWVQRGRRSGRISFTRAGVVRVVRVVDAQITAASSSIPEEQLGSILIATGAVSAEAVRDAVALRAEAGTPVGKALQLAGLISAAAVTDTLLVKIRETVTDVAAWTDGQFELDDAPLGPIGGVPAAIGLDAALSLARRRSTLMGEASMVLGSDGATLYAPAATRIPDAVEVDVELDAKRLWHLVCGGASVAQAAATMGGQRFAVMLQLAAWVRAGVLVLDRRKRVRTESAAELARGAHGRLARGDRDAALSLALAAVQLDAANAAARQAFIVAERSRVAEVARALLATSGRPRAVGEPPSADDPLSRELWLRADGVWDVLSLVRHTGAREAEAILALAQLVQRGAIDL